jgi:iron complex outermembrane receptor protein
VRVANLAELSSNGLHEGIFTFEIGNPQLKNEQLYSMNFFANWIFRKMEFSFSPFYNYFSNYIYLSPTSEQWFGFPVYRYRQQNCKQLGAELGIVYKYSNQLRFQLQASGMNSKKDDGIYTPYTPAFKITPGLLYRWKMLGAPLHVNISMDGYFRQYHNAPYEIPSKAYQLWNAGLNTEWKSGVHTCYLSINGNNLLNATYYDNLSRFKNFGLFNMGRNVSLQFKFVL